ncbi:Fis family transcriptional regulator [Lacimicrobium alkaliphilum]|uniref:Fis family transcriptional regulator n=1 Tax=Lacimicrobium alkaliphilum TaxID=1526571 RepID=A0ABQ1RJ07_9ALTE|nr:Fis family transcriptional regulator [Lacimicrobium alkaliphilum]GGD69335.1 hypothetical protein GCM10011357_25520 [Lacimicrobium alkaliphilum]
MNRNHKKTEASLVKALTLACEEIKSWEVGFSWLTHTVDYPHFPQSLVITCVFETDENVQTMINTSQDIRLRAEITSQLKRAQLLLQNPQQHIALDSEQSCHREHQGNWRKRLEGG